MRHARDGAAAAMDVIATLLVVRAAPRERENPEITWATRAREGMWAPTGDGQRIHIGVDCPGADTSATILRPSLRVFVGVAPDTDIVGQTTAGGVRLLTVLHGPRAPLEFRFPVGLADGLALEAMPSGGFDVVHQRYGATVGRFYAPWACDSMFRPVKAHYRLEEDGALAMRVQHTDAIFPMVVDPLYARMPR